MLCQRKCDDKQLMGRLREETQKMLCQKKCYVKNVMSKKCYVKNVMSKKMLCQRECDDKQLMGRLREDTQPSIVPVWAADQVKYFFSPKNTKNTTKR